MYQDWLEYRANGGDESFFDWVWCRQKGVQGESVPLVGVLDGRMPSPGER